MERDTMSNIKIEIEVRARAYNAKDRHAKTKVYFFNEDESVLEDFGNRVARPKDLYKTYLADVADKLGQPRTTKFSWSQKAGCRCGCSPGFTCGESWGKDVFVTLTGAPKTNDNPEDLVRSVSRVQQLTGQLMIEQTPSVEGVVWC
jgi:hypothetical protein